jgi:O-antigen ligase
MSHYMTQAGITALFISFALGYLFGGFGRRPNASSGATDVKLVGAERAVWGMALILAVAANLLTYTRGAWIGVGAALVVALFLWKPKALIILPVVAALGFLAAPKSIRDRALSIFTMRDNSNIARVQYFKTGMKIIGDYPLFGTGPDTVDMVFQNEKYGLGEYAKHNVHLHSNVIQIAAERGIVTLAAWLAFIILAFLGLRPLRRKPDAPAPPEAVLLRKIGFGALAALTALFVAGFFEYNFGDSEIAQLLFILISLPFAAKRLEKESHDPVQAR